MLLIETVDKPLNHDALTTVEVNNKTVLICPNCRKDLSFSWNGLIRTPNQAMLWIPKVEYFDKLDQDTLDETRISHSQLAILLQAAQVMSIDQDIAMPVDITQTSENGLEICIPDAGACLLLDEFFRYHSGPYKINSAYPMWWENSPVSINHKQLLWTESYELPRIPQRGVIFRVNSPAQA